MHELRISILGECAIRVGRSELTPAASHLFALLLFLTFERDRSHARADLQQLLFANGDDARSASHNLRQLIYRLRRMGVPLEQTISAISLADVAVIGPVEALRALQPQERAKLTISSLDVLPGYCPRLPRCFTNWLDGVRDRVREDVRQLLFADLRQSRDKQEWRLACQFGALMQDLDPLNDEAMSAHAEALAMLGRRNDALDAVDAFIRRCEGDAALVAPARKLRARIAKTPAARREGTLWGREQTLALLDAEWNLLDRGGARLTVVVGPAGIGKTRVAEAFSNRVAMGRGVVIRYRCDADSRYTPLALFSHILPELQSLPGSLGASPDYKSVLARLRPSAGVAEPTIPEGPSIEMLRSELQAALVDLLEAVGTEQRISVLLDDAHLLDDASAAVIRTLSMGANSARVHIVACSRPMNNAESAFRVGGRVTYHWLAPLRDEESRLLIREYASQYALDNDRIEWCVKEATGNPFYLRALALQAPSSMTEVPFDIHTLATTSYYSLGSNCKTALEVCLLLGRFATLSRVITISGLEELALLECLRELEEHDLVHLEASVLRGPHALLHEALGSLIPGSVGALVSRRIAVALEEECVADQFSPDLAWASAQHWIAAGDVATGAQLIRRCAAQAAALGEPAVSADLVALIVDEDLPSTLRSHLLDDLVRYSEASGRCALVASSSRARLKHAQTTNEPIALIKRLAVQSIEGELLNGGSLLSAMDPLKAIVHDTSADSDVRLRAAARLMVIADAELDRTLADLTYAIASQIPPNRGRSASSMMRVELVYHTTFGDQQRAIETAHEIIERFPDAEFDETSYRARTYAGFSLYRMCLHDSALPVFERTYAFMDARAATGYAVYAATMCADILACKGELEASKSWIARAHNAAQRSTSSQFKRSIGLPSVEADLAILEGRYEEADELITSGRVEHLAFSTTRYKAASLSQSVRLQLARDDTSSLTDVHQLHRLYLRGQCLGGQDPIVAALWAAAILAGDEHGATSLLRDYLFRARRELGAPEWLLSHTTGADDGWRDYQRILPTYDPSLSSTTLAAPGET